MIIQVLGALIALGWGGQLLPKPAPTRPAKAVSVHAARSSVGKKVVVCGTVDIVHSDDTQEPILLDLGESGETQRLTVVLQRKNLNNFHEKFGPLLQDREFCVEGDVQAANGDVQLALKDPKQVRFVGQPREGDFAAGVPKPGGPITAPEIAADSIPRYTSNAMKAKIMGDIEVRTIIGANGKVKATRLATSIDPLYGLDEAALRTAAQWTFRPARRDGVAVDCVVTVVLTFRLH